jgi:valyl-tRNA synthetase
MDMFARFKRQTGHSVIFPLGLDRNGLPIEMAAEKKFKIKFNQVSRKEFLKKCELVLKEASTATMDSFQQLGISFNEYEKNNNIGSVYETDSPEYRSLTQDTFIDLWKKNLIYEDKRINNYCPGCQTTLADAEIVYEELPAFFNYIKFKVKGSKEELIIATTRPELICACEMIIFNPKDKRYKHLEGKKAITPIYNKDIPIKSHSSAIIDKGTGIMMMCSFGDVTDIRFFREMNLKPVIAINKDGTMNKNAGFLKGLNIKEAQKKIVMELDKKKLLVKQERIKHRTPICERSKDSIEFIAMQEYYVKQLDQKKKMKQLAKKLNFYSPKSKKILLNWIESVSIDWPISRRRYYATEIPLWKNNKGNIALPKKGDYHQPWKEAPKKDFEVYNPARKKIGLVKDFPKTKWIGEERVFDTWFDSSISPLYILKWGRDNKFFNKAKPCSLRPQGKEIVRTWLYYTVLKDYLLTNELIFKDVWVNYHIVDREGYKMSKSKGNIIDTQEVLKQFGAEPFRLWSVTEGNLVSTDFRCSFERIEGAGKTLMKLWNVAKFISSFSNINGKIKYREVDNWIRKELNLLVEYSKKSFENYDFHNPAIKLKQFIWETFSSHYLEMVKNRAYNEDKNFSNQEQNGALETLNYCLKTLLEILSPILPFITAKLYEELYAEDVHTRPFPTITKFNSKLSKDEILKLNSLVWKTKKDEGISLNSEIKLLQIPSSLESISKDLKTMHNAKEVKKGKPKIIL